MGKPENIEPAYAGVKVAEIDARLADLEAEKKSLTEKRKLYASAVPKRTAAKTED